MKKTHDASRLLISILTLLFVSSALAETPNTTGTKIHKTWRDPVTGLEFVYISQGAFSMGSPLNESGRFEDEQPHRVTLTKGFYIQTTEVTQGQWKAVMGGNPSYFKYCGDDCPVNQVSWNDVQSFIQKLNQREGVVKYRLPTEAEWEYAARANSYTARYWGSDPDDACRYANVHDQTSRRLNEYDWIHHDCDDGYTKTAPVGSLLPNAFGLYDMLGNVWEWCNDWYGKYPSGSVTDPAGPPSSNLGRVSRSGSWYLQPRRIRSAYRSYNSPGFRHHSLGFRLVRVP